MEQEQALKQYIRPGIGLTIVTWVFFALMILGIIFAASAGKSDPATATAYEKDGAKYGDYVYVDVIGVTDWVCQYDNEIYYNVMDSEGVMYTVRMSNAEFSALKACNDWWNDENVDALPPPPERIYGLVRAAADDMLELMAQAWELDGVDAYCAEFGPDYVDVGSTPATRSEGLWGALAFLSFAVWLTFFCVWAPSSAKAGKCIKRLEAQGWMPAAAAEFAASRSCEPDKDRVRLTEHFMFGKHTGAAVAYADVFWCYRRMTRMNLIPLAEGLLLQTMWGRNIVLVNKSKFAQKSGEDLFDFLFRAINTQNPYARIGFTAENAKAYRAARKAQQG